MVNVLQVSNNMRMYGHWLMKNLIKHKCHLQEKIKTIIHAANKNEL